LTDVHHLDLVSEGGTTEMSNLITLCVPHHSRVHELGWTMDGDAQTEVHFISPHGEVLSSTPVRAWKQRRE
jgi:HNH endonuclease